MVEDPIENIVELLIKREKILSLPVNIEKIATQYSDFKKIDIPFDFDGITIKEKGKKPQIIVNVNRGRQRQNFTIAHELGHIVIPWHIGTILDKSIDDEDGIDYEYAIYEAEANKFSSSLLLPSSILKKRIESFLTNNSMDVGTFIKKLSSDADVSLLTTTFRVFRFLPPNFVYLITNGNLVVYSGKSRGTNIKIPHKGEPLKNTDNIISENEDSFFYNDRLEFYFLKVQTKLKRATSAQHTEDINWRETLREILSKNFKSEEISHKSYLSVNAIIGSYYGTHLKKKNYDFNTFYDAIYERVLNHEKLKWLIEDDLFDTFITQKISELFDKDGKAL